MVSQSVKGWLVLGIVVALGFAAYLGVKNKLDKNSVPLVVSSDAGRQQELRRRAETGEPDAQLALSLVLQGTPEGDSLLKKAADSGYGPAVVTLARRALGGDQQLSQSAAVLLEKAARNGYYPAAVELADCLRSGSCGARSAEDALMWVIASRYWAKEGKIKSNLLHDVEAKLMREVSSARVPVIQQRARDLVASVQMKDSD